MSHCVTEPVVVVLRALTEGGTVPAAFTWRSRRYQVQSILGVWKESGRWWDGEGDRVIYRVAALPEPVPRRGREGASSGTGTYELRYEESDRKWVLQEIQD